MSTILTKLVATTTTTQSPTQGQPPVVATTWSETEGSVIDLINPLVPLATPAGSLIRIGLTALLLKAVL